MTHPKTSQLTADDYGVLANAAGNNGVVYVARNGSDSDNDVLAHLNRLTKAGLFRTGGDERPMPFFITEAGLAELAARA